MDYRDQLIELVEDGILDPMMAVTMCAKWMTNDEVGEMLDANELSERFMETEECKYCGGDCPNDEDNACDGYLGDIDGLYEEAVIDEDDVTVTPGDFD